jgi:hypothetical protein
MNRTTDTDIRAVLSYFGHPEGREAGSFLTRLIEAMGVADLDNFDKLSLAFPEIAVPFNMASREPEGTRTLLVALTFKASEFSGAGLMALLADVRQGLDLTEIKRRESNTNRYTD